MTRSSRWLRSAAVAGIVGAFAQNAWVFESVVASRYDIYTSYVSDLGAKTEHNWWFWTASDEVAGVLTVIFAVAVIPLYRELARRAWWAVLGAVAFLLVGVGTIADGFLRLPCPESLSAECEARIAAGTVGWVYHARQIESTFTSVVTAFAIVLLAWGLLGDERWRSAGRWMWYLMLPFAALNIVAGLDAALNVGWPGFWDRMLLISASISSLPPMIRLWHSRRSTSARRWTVRLEDRVARRLRLQRRRRREDDARRRAAELARPGRRASRLPRATRMSTTSEARMLAVRDDAQQKLLRVP